MSTSSRPHGPTVPNDLQVLASNDSRTQTIPKLLASQETSSVITVEVIDSCELAKRLNVPETWVRSRTNRKRTSDPIPHFRLGRYVRFPWGSDEFREWLDRQLVSANRAGH